ncbi:T6SS phospholipase effector Tle1-like catalytic domain-containing protein [Massilia horti]|uniref:DUF2235 domain-containing protein n=1 Tax=Massilia horti TaxID=2562153 RepID=A0A4Y9T646_9BURK|nr:DUF2235 domain-containing protein [Massilia horti]TFW33605.1 DUF2235 domain-containing protein [Massilia horti]
MKAVRIHAAACLTAPTNVIKPVDPKLHCDANKCQIRINVGLFFDGTNNNMEKDLANRADSNIARLYNAYPRKTSLGYFSQYIPGVGTKFEEIGEKTQSTMGEGFGQGCESRVLFGLLTFYNFLHRAAFSGLLLFENDEIKALCMNVSDMERKDSFTLQRLEVPMGLVGQYFEDEGNRTIFLRKHASLLEAKLKKSKPQIVECFLDVFGFSRGAAEARVFCNWLNQLMSNGKLAGVRIRFRFVGIFDTVASAGFWSGTAAGVTSGTGGHSCWAQAKFLRLPSNVENCIHMVAMHELRRNFPLDEIGENGVMPAGWQQYAYPGSHSDVGGGYKPGELGISVGKTMDEGDSLKLSQIPLNHMLDCAIASGAALSSLGIGMTHLQSIHV